MSEFESRKRNRENENDQTQSAFNKKDTQLVIPADKYERRMKNKEQIKCKRLPKETIEDLASNLEYIISLGINIRYSSNRCINFSRELEETNTSRILSVPKKKVHSSDSVAINDRLSESQQITGTFIHAEDRHIYLDQLRRQNHLTQTKHSNNEHFYTWPSNRPVKRNDPTVDKEWDDEYGDSIDMKDFKKQLLQKLSPPHCEWRNETDEDETLEQILQQTWERALHATTQCISCNTPSTFLQKPGHTQPSSLNTKDNKVSQDSVDKVDTTLSKNDVVKKNELNVKMDPETCDIIINATSDNLMDSLKENNEKSQLIINQTVVAKCAALNIYFKDYVRAIKVDGKMNYRCKICNSDNFSSKKQLKCHFYGTQRAHKSGLDSCSSYGAQYSKGCCIKLIDEKHHQIINKVLEKELMIVIDNLLHLLFSESQKRNIPTESETKELKATPMNWLDIVQLLEKKYREKQENIKESSTVLENSKNINKTLQVSEMIPPFPFDENIIKVVKKRLVERYSMEPR